MGTTSGIVTYLDVDLRQNFTSLVKIRLLNGIENERSGLRRRLEIWSHMSTNVSMIVLKTFPWRLDRVIGSVLRSELREAVNEEEFTFRSKRCVFGFRKKKKENFASK